MYSQCYKQHMVLRRSFYYRKPENSETGEKVLEIITETKQITKKCKKKVFQQKCGEEKFMKAAVIIKEIKQSDLVRLIVDTGVSKTLTDACWHTHRNIFKSFFNNLGYMKHAFAVTRKKTINIYVLLRNLLLTMILFMTLNPKKKFKN